MVNEKADEWSPRERYSQLVDAAVVKLDLCADEHLTGFLRIEPQLNTGPI